MKITMDIEINTMDLLTTDDQKLLAEVLISQDYAVEVLSSELNDIEAGMKNTDRNTYLRLISLYDRLRIK